MAEESGKIEFDLHLPTGKTPGDVDEAAIKKSLTKASENDKFIEVMKTALVQSTFTAHVVTKHPTPP